MSHRNPFLAQLVCFVSMATACSDDGSSGQDTSTTEPTAGSTAGSTIGSTIGSTTGSTTAGTTGDSTGGTANADTTGPNDDSTSASTGQPETPTICPIDENFGDPVPEGAQPYPVALDFRGAEGIVWNADEQRLYFSEIFRQGAPEDCPLREDRMCGSIVRLDPQTGESEVFVTAASTNGLALPLEGGQLIAGSFTRDLVAFALDEGLEPEPVTFVPQRIRPPIFNSPNDLTIRSDGTIYFTDPWFGIPEKLQSGITPIWRVSPMGDVSIVTENTIVPNGIALSPDESTLYVTTRLVENEPENQRILQLDVQEDGTATNEREFVTLQGGGADGMTIDCAGNLYATLFRSGGGDDPGPPGVEIYRPSGELIQSITFPNPNDDTALLPATNAAFGGSDRTTLFVTVEQRNPDPALRVFGVYGVDLNIPGLPY